MSRTMSALIWLAFVAMLVLAGFAAGLAAYNLTH